MRILLEPNLQKDKAVSITKQVVSILHKDHVSCILPDSLKASLFIPEVQYLEKQEAYDTCDMIISIGGDGTLLHAAEGILSNPKPLLGINIGRLGFLTSLEESELSELSALAKGAYTVEHRRLLQAYLPRTGETSYALNEFAVASCGMMRAIRFSVYCDDIKINDYRGDGVIVATPTGSTAYSLSAGGPIVDADVDAVIVTPVCAHSLNTPPLVLSENRKITIHLAEIDQDVSVMFAADGGRQIFINEQDCIEISLSAKSLPLVSLFGNQQLKAIDQKLKGR